MYRKLSFGAVSLLSFLLLSSPQRVYAEDTSGADSNATMRAGNQLYQRGEYLQAARYFFSAYTAEGSHQSESLSRLTEALIRARYPQLSVYFYIKTLKSGSRPAIVRILRYLPELISNVGGDVLRTYIVENTSESEFDSETRNQFYYFLGKSHLLKGDAAPAIEALKKVNLRGRGMGASAALVKASAFAMAGQPQAALDSFRTCESNASSESGSAAFDLENRCIAGRARILYETGKYDEAEEVYDDISKKSFVWTDILFEQAWNAFAKGDYNRALGKLVSYESPALQFVFNPEIEVLRAQSFAALCLWDDVNKSINQFNQKYYDLGIQMKQQLMTEKNDFPGLFAMGRNALKGKLHTNDQFQKALNRFARGSYFASIVQQEAATTREIYRFRAQLSKAPGPFADFMEKALHWRLRSVRILGGVFVRNSLLDLYNDLLADFDKMSFLKSEMLSQMKSRIERKHQLSADDNGQMKRGTKKADRKDYQYYWGFNGEFWNDELGDYVFALESECH